MLIKSGMSIKQAICYNLVSAVLSYIGLVIGILVGNYSADGRQFALALTAGLFLYVALATMVRFPFKKYLLQSTLSSSSYLGIVKMFQLQKVRIERFES